MGTEAVLCYVALGRGSVGQWVVLWMKMQSVRGIVWQLSESAGRRKLRNTVIMVSLETGRTEV